MQTARGFVPLLGQPSMQRSEVCLLDGISCGVVVSSMQAGAVIACFEGVERLVTIMICLAAEENDMIRRPPNLKGTQCDPGKARRLSLS